MFWYLRVFLFYYFIGFIEERVSQYITLVFPVSIGSPALSTFSTETLTSFLLLSYTAVILIHFSVCGVFVDVGDAVGIGVFVVCGFVVDAGASVVCGFVVDTGASPVAG